MLKEDPRTEEIRKCSHFNRIE